jgi:hypothetical protein
MRTARVLADDSASPTYSKNVLRRPMHAKVPTQAGPATAQMRGGVSPAPAKMCADAIVSTAARLPDGPEAVGGRDREVVHADARCEVRVEPRLRRRNTERCNGTTLQRCNAAAVQRHNDATWNSATTQHGTVQRRNMEQCNDTGHATCDLQLPHWALCCVVSASALSAEPPSALKQNVSDQPRGTPHPGSGAEPAGGSAR